MSGMETKQVRLGDYCSITSSKRVFESEYVTEGVPFFRSKEIIERESGKTNTDFIYITQNRYDEIKEKFGVPQPGDILLTSVGTLGIPYVIKTSDLFYFKDGNLTWMRDFCSDMDSKYLYYWLRSGFGKQSLIQRAIGSSQAAITIDILKKYQLLLPTIEKQKRIVSILSAYDELIEKNNRKIEILQEQAQELYKEWFVRLRFPGHEAAKFENDLPEGWVECRFSEKADIMSGGTPKTDETSYYGGSIPFYTPKDSVDNFFSFETLTNITEEGLAHCNSQLYPARTVMITARGTVGNINLLAVPMAMNQSCYALKMKAVDCPYFLFFSLMQEIIKLKCIATGGVFDTIIVKTFDTIRLVMPKTNMLMQFEKAISPIMEQILYIEKKNNNLICQRDLLLPRLMSGKLEVK